MKKTHYPLLGLIILAVVLVFAVSKFKNQDREPAPAPQTQQFNRSTVDTRMPDGFPEPIENAEERVTKKPFGIYAKPGFSPVEPEHFVGFHTGTDFEILPGEENIEVPIFAICDGKILEKKTAQGYGGVLAQSCTIQNQPVVVVYGHLSLQSIPKTIGDELKAKEKIGILGQPPNETDNERKHLHLGIHKGTQLVILGYVQKESELSNWIDFQSL